MRLQDAFRGIGRVKDAQNCDGSKNTTKYSKEGRAICQTM